MSSDKSVDRAEAIRRSMLAMIESGGANEVHPALWAPFVVVGEGSSVVTHVQATPAMPIKVAPSPKKSAAKLSLKKQAPWTADIWRKQAN
jgi:hypothetical protein